MRDELYGLTQTTLYRIPATSVSHHPELANRCVWWSGEHRQLPANGGRMDRFVFADTAESVWLRPFGVVPVR